MNEPKKVNGQQNLRLNGEQLAAMLVIESVVHAMQVGMDQLGGFVKYEPGTQVLVQSHAVLVREYERLREMWARSVLIAPASALSVIEGKKVG